MSSLNHLSNNVWFNGVWCDTVWCMVYAINEKFKPFKKWCLV